ALQLVDGLRELRDVLEGLVDRGKAYVGDLIQPLEMIHHQLADLTAADLLLGSLVQPGLDVGHHLVDTGQADRPLGARLEDGGPQLLAIELFPAAVLLGDVKRHVLDVLVGRVAAAALQALAAPADELAVPSDPRIDDAVLGVTAERTLHRFPPVTAGARDRAGSGW